MEKTSIKIDVDKLPPPMRTAIIGLASRMGKSPQEAVVCMVEAATANKEVLASILRRRRGAEVGEKRVDSVPVRVPEKVA